MRKTLCLCMICLAALAGCDPPKPKAKPAIEGSHIVAPRPASSSAPLIDAYKKQFVDHILSVVNGRTNGDVVDPNLMLARTADQVEVPASQRADFISETRLGYEKNTLGTNLSTEISNGGISLS